MRFEIITIFPHIFNSYFGESIIKRAQEKRIIEIGVHNLRDYSADKHKNVDDTPYGGGAGMVMQIQPIYDCVHSIIANTQNCLPSDRHPNVRTILFSAKGKRYTQTDVKRLATYDRLILICGRYEGVDERVAERVADEELSIGDFILTGGEIPAMVVVDSVTRLLDGVLGNSQSVEVESHSSEGYLEYPQYTKPEEFHGWAVPSILLSGNHGEIEKWRMQKSKENAYGKHKGAESR